MKIAMMQPHFLPWQGFFELILNSDVFIILDDFQFSKQSYHQRNRLFVNNKQVDWYTVPIQKSVSIKSPLNEVKINEITPWRKKIWNRIRYNYSKAQMYDNIAPHIEKWLFTDVDSLATLNINFIKLVCELIGINRDICFSSEHPSKLIKSERVLELLRWHQADYYYSANGSFPYMHEEGIFPTSDITVLFQNFQSKPYRQSCSLGHFVPNLSILDALMNVGTEKTLELIQNGTKKWLTWDEMIYRSAE